MKILHLFLSTNYDAPKSIIRFIDDNFQDHDHEIIIIDNKENIPEKIKSHKKVQIIEKSNSLIHINNILLERIKNNDKILMHSISQLSNLTKLNLMLKPNLFEKITWIAWGVDLYEWKKPLKSVKSYFNRLIEWSFRKKIKTFVGIFPPDIDFFIQQFNSRAQTIYASYPGPLYNPIYIKNFPNENINKKLRNNSPINIQIGHQSNPILNHIDVLYELKRFKNENIKIYIPLSYGNKNYGDKVEKVARDIFGDKAIIMRNRLSLDDYMLLLSSINIAIFNTDRQIGLGNINPLLFMRKKIFIPKQTVMYDFFHSKNINISDYDEINNISFESFIEEVDMENGKKYVDTYHLSKENKINMWEKVFED